jgi:hypothetical protein
VADHDECGPDRRLVGTLSMVLALGLLITAVFVPRAVAAGHGARACPDGDYTMNLATERHAGDVLELVWFSLRGPYPCRLDTRLSTAVQPVTAADSKPSAAIGAIAGNPRHAGIDAVLRPGSLTVRAWEWGNWCARPRRAVLFARTPAAEAQLWSAPVRSPACQRSGQPSLFRAVNPGLRACPASRYRLTLTPGQGYRLRIIEGVSIAPGGGTPCRWAGRVKLTLQSRTRTGWAAAVGIVGNGVTYRFASVLARTAVEPVSWFWAWANWCGSAASLRWLAQVGARTRALAVSQTPACGQAGAASSLSPFFNPPVPVRPAGDLSPRSPAPACGRGARPAAAPRGGGRRAGPPPPPGPAGSPARPRTTRAPPRRRCRRR